MDGFSRSGFNQGDHLLDLGCGPGFVTRDLAYMVGNQGKVIAVDRSKYYLDFLEDWNKTHHLNIETQHADFDHMQLKPNSLDGAYCRWALAWVPNPRDVIQKVVDSPQTRRKIPHP